MNYVIPDKQQFKQYQEAFRQLSRGKIATTQDHVLYNLIRGRDLRCGFSPFVNEKKINSHYNKNPWRTFEYAVNNLKFNIKHRKTQREHHERSGQKYGWAVPFCMRYGETLTEEHWTNILTVLEAHK